MLFSAPEPDERELQVLSEVEKLKKSLRHQLNEPHRWTGPLRRLSAARAIQGSNSIEGYDAKLDDAAAIIAGEEPLDADAETRLALAGYGDAMTYVLQLADDEDFAYGTQLLKSLHFMMTNYDMQNRPGRWRAGDIYVRKEDTGEIVYQGPPPDQVPGLVEELVVSLNAPTAGEPHLIQAGMAHLNFVMIHPFRDGNGRMARCLQSLVLARTGVLSPVFISIEEYLGRNTLRYYDVLAEVGGGAWHPSNDARPWVRFTITAHLRQARTMLVRIRETERLWVDLDRLVRQERMPDRTLLPLFDAIMGLRVRNATYRASLQAALEGEITEPTASKDLQRLVDADLLIPHGEKRARFYTASDRVMQIRRALVAERDRRNDSDPFAA
jgi:Fic family protein